MEKINLLKKLASAFVLSTLLNFSYAIEGMWMPAQLEKQAAEMKKLGLLIPISELYNDDGNALNNAVVLYGRGCTGEVVSKNGLLFTNHHCAYSNAQTLSTVDKNFLLDGFWAKSRSEELSCPGLSVTFVRKTINVTDYMLKNISPEISEAERQKKLKEKADDLKAVYKKMYGLDCDIKSYYHGNEYWASLQETFNDVRLVGFPPNGIGKFGGDTDNWMWPRMTGDFAVLRIYADANNKPADYSPHNKPYTPKRYFKINAKGIKEGDFTMVYGFPAATNQYITSFQLSQTQHIIDPIRIAARDKKLAVWDEAMRQDPAIFLKYAAKQSSVSNGYKKWKGEVLGLEANNVMQKKQDFEKKYQAKAQAYTADTQFNNVLPQIEALSIAYSSALKSWEYLNETVLGIEIVRQSGMWNRLLDFYRGKSTDGSEKLQEQLHNEIKAFFKNYDAPTDQKVFLALMPMYLEQGHPVVAPNLEKLYYNAGKNYQSWSNSVFKQSLLLQAEELKNILSRMHPADSIKILQDPAYLIYHHATGYYKNEFESTVKNYQSRIVPLQRKYMEGQLKLLPAERNYYPDANQSLRLSFGKVDGIESPGKGYAYQTLLSEAIKRHNPNVIEFNIPENLRTIYQQKTLGRWSSFGDVPVNFIASNHTTGGNSGSPILNAKGELIGINFDRIFQGTMSDLYFDSQRCRNIGVDIRYVLFIIEQFGKSDYLFKELDIIK